MKITRQLRLDTLAAASTAPIQLIITWESTFQLIGYWHYSIPTA